MITKVSYIKKLPDGQYRVYSEKGRNMGTYGSRAAAQKRIKDIEYFKHQDDVRDGDANHYYDRGGLGEVPEFWRKNFDYDGERQRALDIKSREKVLNKKLAKLVDSLEKLGFNRDSDILKDLLAVI